MLMNLSITASPGKGSIILEISILITRVLSKQPRKTLNLHHTKEHFQSRSDVLQ